MEEVLKEEYYSPGQNKNDEAPAESEGAFNNEKTEIVLDDLLKEMVDKSGSDLHIKVGQPPVVRIHGMLKRLENYCEFTNSLAEELIFSILNDERKEILSKEKELDLAYSISGVARFRVNIFFQKENIGAVFRVIPFDIKSFDDLGIPEIAKELCEYSNGLILVTGPTGSGKSTTLAAMIDYINSNNKKHIVTIEDPIEFLHRDKKSAVNQREIGVDTHSFASALKHILRQSPDVILVGELRDLETISLAITAAETGHLVFATLHTTDAAQTIDRIIDVFSPEEQQQVRLQLSYTLRGVVSQTLLARKDGSGRVAAFEILICHSGIRNMIREGKTHQINNLIQTGGEFGMMLLDKSLKELLQQNLIDFEDALAKCSNPKDFEMFRMQFGNKERLNAR